MRPAVLLAGMLLAAGSAADTLHLPIGDPARRDVESRVVLDAITDTRTGEVIASAELARRLADTRILFIGEEHTNAAFHRVQLRTLQALVDAGREVMIGLEMFPYTRQDVVDRWSSGALSEDEFMDPWYEHWSHHWGYYRDIFNYAREHRLPLKAVNVPREVVRQARTQGFDAFDAQTRAHLPPTLDTDSAEHRRLFAASFASDDSLHTTLPEAQREGLYRAQVTWDAAMGWNAAQALQANGKPHAIMVVLLGSGHVAYGLGAQRQIEDDFAGTVRSLIPVATGEPGGAATVQSSYADFVWGVPAQSAPQFPVLGVSLAGSLGKRPTLVIQVEKDSSAQQAGVEVGDVLLSLNGHEIKSSSTLQRWMSDLRWGDRAVLELRRGEEVRRVDVVLRPAPASRSSTPPSPSSAPTAAPPITTAAHAATPRTLPDYRLQIALDPPNHQLSVQATLQVPARLAGQAVEFLLADSLRIEKANPAVERLSAGNVAGFVGINGSSEELTGSGRAARYRVQLPPGNTRLELAYRGIVNTPLTTPPEESARSFSETSGLIDERGVYLAGSSLWYPYLGSKLFTFELQARAPEGWHLISPGNGTSRDTGGVARWQSPLPVDELHLVGGPLTRYTAAAGAVEALVYLRSPDEALAGRYLEATARDVEMYRALIGPYPYGKFALVENFWETGYGMPSFTLLGPQIIRFPFILTSSYPHEILHNWWGNSVFVDYDTGNWCEGLTAYLADHLFKEQAGQGAEYRRDTLKRYRDYVREGRDFPLSQFRSRHSAATEAVGYGKTLMGFHMLRRELGEETFRKALADFYRTWRAKRASFQNVRETFEKASGRDLKAFFEQWVQQAGAPELRLESVRVSRAGTQFVVSGELQQRGTPWRMNVPLSVRTASGTHEQTLTLGQARTPFRIELAQEPLLLAVDPQFDVFRLLDARETAPSLGQIFGEPKVLAVLPAAAGAEQLAAYRAMLDSWPSPAQAIDVRLDRDVGELPADRAVWVIGRDNELASRYFASDAALGLHVDGTGVGTPAGKIGFAGNSSVIVRRHPRDAAKAIGWISVDPLAAAPGLARKLPHYGKYSYLGFAGEEPTNTVKGEWPGSDSPLRSDLRPASARTQALPAEVRTTREPLAQLPAAFSQDRLLGHVRFLAAPERDGRGLGTKGLQEAAHYIAREFHQAGLHGSAAARQSQFAASDYLQPFEATAGEGPPQSTHNVIGVLPGANPAFAGQAVLVTAHYDHLGREHDSIRSAERGQVHPGADDNASGVAVLIELARALGSAAPPPRTIVFVAFSGEESGLLGSRHYAEHPAPVAVSGIRAVINLDTVGRLGDGDIRVLATETASEWPHVVRGVGFTTGLKLQSVPGTASSSDQQSFIERGIPGVQIFTGANADYHRPTDTADKIDTRGMVAVATAVREMVGYLAERADPLTVSVKSASPAASPGADATAAGTTVAGARRVSFGVVPDFAYPGPGVRAESVVADSPAAAAGLRAGDVVLALNDAPIADLAAFSAALKTFSAGQRVRTRIGREGVERTVEVNVVER